MDEQDRRQLMGLQKVNIELTKDEMHSAVTSYIADNWVHGEELRTLLEEQTDLVDGNKFIVSAGDPGYDEESDERDFRFVFTFDAPYGR